MKPTLDDVEGLDIHPEGSFVLRAGLAISDAVLAIALIGELAAVFGNVIARALFETAFLWTDEVAKLALSTLAFVGGASAYARGHHTFIRSMLDRIPKAERVFLVLSELVVLLIAVVTAYSSLLLLETRSYELTPILQMPASSIVWPMTLSMMLIAIYALERLFRQHRPTVLGCVLMLGSLLAIAMTTRGLWLTWLTGDSPIFIALILFFSTIVVGLPVGFALLLATMTYLWIADASPMVALPQNMVDGTGNFVLLALPFFIFAGLIMERGGISLRLVGFVHALVGHLRGGLLHVMVVSMYLVSGLSGSKTADVAAVGSVMRDMLRKEKYSLAEGAAVLAASAAMGETVPPSIAMLVLGSITTLSMAALFLGGLIPAAVIALCLMVLIYFQAKRNQGEPKKRASLKVIADAGLHAILPLLMPVILFAGILLGLATPTEVSSFAVVYGLALATLVYRELNWKTFVRTVIDGATLAGMVLFILGAASSFSWTLTVAYLPQRLVEILQSANNSTIAFMIGSIVLLIIVGSLLEGLPALIILAPLLLPIAGQIGLSELHYGIVLLIAMGVGAFMPPVGIGFYVACAIVRIDIETASRAMLPYLIVLMIGLLIVAFVPWFTLFLPNAFNLGG
ncbi:MAG TPA: TRAP transporter large permease subunit [Xanthobacteraceae bacterium]|nr:TRAP transporter large permease subunit [Xanthobacteraceae bacterium]